MATPKKIFFAYSDQLEDLDLYKKIHKHFAAYSSIGLVGIIDKKEIFKLAGDEAKTLEILKNSDITIPLLSIDFINNEACLKQLETAAGNNKIIIPVLLRDFDWEAFTEIKKYRETMLPGDRTPVENHIAAQGNDDTILKEIAQQVKAVIFPEFKNMQVQKSSHTFYYIIAAMVLVIGIVASILLYKVTDGFDMSQRILISALSLLMFASIGLVALKNVIFPNKLNIKR